LHTRWRDTRHKRRDITLKSLFIVVKNLDFEAISQARDQVVHSVGYLLRVLRAIIHYIERSTETIIYEEEIAIERKLGTYNSVPVDEC